uniref:RING finger and SPRY domain-containing protein 1 n=1 Tax=Graphocephala atropunctata TaxID=36148 RepID=A0A1B6LFK8_9HEMI
MGVCLCKCKEEEQSVSTSNHDRRRRISSNIQAEDQPDWYMPGSGSNWWKSVPAKVVDNLVLDTLNVIGTLVENEEEPPEVLLKLHNIADQEYGWIQVVQSMVNVIPVEDPLGPAVITLLLDDCPLPNKEAVLRLSKLFTATQKSVSEKGHKSVRVQRNMSIVLGVLAEKLSGPSSVAILTPQTLAYLIANLEDCSSSVVTLFSIIALEKFAQTSENKATIMRELSKRERGNPLLVLETRVGAEDLVDAQVGFCAQWCLDNLFVMEGRTFSYKETDMSVVNAMLNTNDVSEYLKIAPDGLEARCDAYSFESVRCTFQVDSGVWYYETTILSCGVMQIGWATKNSKFLNHEGYGIGDDECSIAYDGCRQLVWYNARSHAQCEGQWRAGDVLGCLLDLTAPLVQFYINGRPVASSTQLFNSARCGFFAAASFMSFQQCRFNFGSKPFQFPPTDVQFQSFNEHATLTSEQRIVLPRHLQLELLRRMSVREDSCTICFDNRASVCLQPCGHKGFCTKCSSLLTECPMCRGVISSLDQDNT